MCMYACSSACVYVYVFQKAKSCKYIRICLTTAQRRLQNRSFRLGTCESFVDLGIYDDQNVDRQYHYRNISARKYCHMT